jgi:hypothetical protein
VSFREICSKLVNLEHEAGRSLHSVKVPAIGTMAFLHLRPILQLGFTTTLEPNLSLQTKFSYSDQDTSWTTRVRFPDGAGYISLLHCVQTGSGAHPASSSNRTESSFSKGKAAVHEADHSLLCSVEVKNAWSYTSIPPYIFIARCLVKQMIHLHDRPAS